MEGLIAEQFEDILHCPEINSFSHSPQVERKRARNRVAASKCRLRKLERISVLDAQAQNLKSDNERLAALADKLRYIILVYYRVTMQFSDLGWVDFVLRVPSAGGQLPLATRLLLQVATLAEANSNRPF